MDMTDPVITGAAVVSSLGPGLNETWEALMEGESGIAPLDSFDASAFPDARAALVKGLDPTDFGVKARELRIMGRHSLMLMKAALDAWEDAGLADRGVPMEGVGFFAGMGMVDHDVDDLLPAVKKSLTPDGRIDYRRFYEGAFREIYPLWPLSMLNNIAFCQVAIRLGIRGENAVFSPHGDSTIHAFYEAAGMIREGKAEMVLAGGVSEEVKPASLARAYLTGICGPHDNGVPPGEGAGVFLLETGESAERAGRRIYGAIGGFGFGLAGPDSPAEDAFLEAMKGAIRSAGLEPPDIDLVFLNRSGREDWFEGELASVEALFGKKVSLYSSKDALGEMLAGSPAVDLALSLKAMAEGRVPALNGKEPGGEEIRAVLINTMSYEGQVASMVVRRP